MNALHGDLSEFWKSWSHQRMIRFGHETDSYSRLIYIDAAFISGKEMSFQKRVSMTFELQRMMGIRGAVPLTAPESWYRHVSVLVIDDVFSSSLSSMEVKCLFWDGHWEPGQEDSTLIGLGRINDVTALIVEIFNAFEDCWWHSAATSSCDKNTFHRQRKILIGSCEILLIFPGNIFGENNIVFFKCNKLEMLLIILFSTKELTKFKRKRVQKQRTLRRWIVTKPSDPADV
jgi:hypothetical protein